MRMPISSPMNNSAELFFAISKIPLKTPTPVKNTLKNFSVIEDGPRNIMNVQIGTKANEDKT
jgi:hypothetical protein